MVYILAEQAKRNSSDELFHKLEERLKGKIEDIENEIDDVRQHKKGKIDLEQLDRYDRYVEMESHLKNLIEALEEKNRKVEKVPVFRKSTSSAALEKDIDEMAGDEEKEAEEIIPLGERFRIEKEIAILSTWLMGMFSFIVGAVYLIKGNYSINNAVVMGLGGFLMLTTLILMRRTN